MAYVLILKSHVTEFQITPLETPENIVIKKKKKIATKI